MWLKFLQPATGLIYVSILFAPQTPPMAQFATSTIGYSSASGSAAFVLDFPYTFNLQDCLFFRRSAETLQVLQLRGNGYPGVGNTFLPEDFLQQLVSLTVLDVSLPNVKWVDWIAVFNRNPAIKKLVITHVQLIQLADWANEHGNFGKPICMIFTIFSYDYFFRQLQMAST